MNALNSSRRLWPSILRSLLLWTFSDWPCSQAATVGVNVGDNFFSPTTVAINVNDTVNWSWVGFSQHSSTSNTGLWDSGIHGRGFSFSKQFTSAGSFPYFCRVHPFQTGSVTVQAANSPPIVSIANPANGAVINAPANFNISATASDADGTVTQVEFFQNTSSLGIKTASPYTIAVNNLAAGTYTVTAVATDNAGAKATNSISVIVNALPTVMIMAPANGATFAEPLTTIIQATATDSDGNVKSIKFFIGSILLGTVSAPPYDLTVTNVVAGSHALTVVVTDNRDGSTTSSVVTISVVKAVPIQLSAWRRLPPSTFQFNHTANAGLRYVVERSVDLTNWSSIKTNIAGSSLVNFTDDGASAGRNFYRVRLLPNP